MNPQTQTEYLSRIRARCVELLAIAEKRTPGKWKSSGVYFGPTYPHAESCVNSIGCVEIKPGEHSKPTLADENCAKAFRDAAFISACAGSAEAGWKSTIAAIDVCTELPSPDSSLILSKIRAAWPEELL